MNQIEVYTPSLEEPEVFETSVRGTELCNLAYNMASDIRAEITRAHNPKTKSERNEVNAMLAYVHVTFGPAVFNDKQV